MVKFKIETEMLMISSDRTKYSLLTESSYQLCNSGHLKFCKPETAIYQTNLNKRCLIFLFMKKYDDIEKHCIQIMITGYDLPASIYLSFGMWIV